MPNNTTACKTNENSIATFNRDDGSSTQSWNVARLKLVLFGVAANVLGSFRVKPENIYQHAHCKQQLRDCHMRIGSLCVHSAHIPCIACQFQ